MLECWILVIVKKSENFPDWMDLIGLDTKFFTDLLDLQIFHHNMNQISLRTNHFFNSSTVEHLSCVIFRGRAKFVNLGEDDERIKI